MMKYLIIGMLSATMILFITGAKKGVKTNNLQDSIKHTEQFGMRMRKVPVKTSGIYEPVIVNEAPGNEATIVRLTNEIKIFFVNRPGEANKLMSVSSTDNGISWSQPNKEFDLPGQAYYANNLVKDSEGNLHCVFHIFGTGKNGYRGRHLNLWYCRTEKNGTEWGKPKKIYDGYVGSMRSFVQLKNKRLVFAFAKAVPERMEKPKSDNTIDYGWNDVSVLYSDDMGENWEFSKDDLRIPVEATQTTRYGAIEPNVLELANEQLWMLIRTNKGHLYQSFSNDFGTSWQQPEKTNFISSDSPATTLRLADNRIVMIWSSNQRWDDKRSYAIGGREVLHAAISGDEGKTWKGFREVLVSPSKQNEKGDRGTAYPSAVQSSDGKIVFVSGQAEERAIVKFDPDWLEQTQAKDDFSKGLVQWTSFGSTNTAKLVLPDPRKQSAGLQIYKLNGISDAVWNFPMSPKGKLLINLIVKPGNKGIKLAFTDHFSVSTDKLASDNAVFNFTIKPESLKLFDKINRIEVIWDMHHKTSALYLNNLLLSEKPFERIPSFGINYLRLGIPGNAPDPSGFFVQSVKMKSVN